MLLLVLQVAIFAVSAWLGFYLIARRSPHDALVFTGLGLLLVALAAALGAFRHGVDADGLDGLAGFVWVTALGLIAFGLYLSKPIAGNSAFRRLAMVGAGLALAVALFTFAGVLIDVSSGAVRTLVLAAIFALSGAIGFWLARRDAEQRRESLLPDLLRSFDYSFLVVLLFAGQVVIAMVAGPGVTGAMLALLLAVIATSIATQVFLDQVQSALDRVAFANIPWLQELRSDLRETASSLPRRRSPLDLDEDEFVRITRRALSDFGDLTKLSASPLINIALVDERINVDGAAPTSLERAGALKSILAEAIATLKPAGDDSFGTTDEWRYYNALYFPYVVGMRPYSQRAVHDFGEQSDQDALDWFRTYVPERTLHNWQTAAARLVAQHLREQSGVDVPTERELAATRT